MATTTANTAHVTNFFSHLFSSLGHGATYLPALKEITAAGSLIPPGRLSPQMALILTMAAFAEGAIEAHQAGSEAPPAPEAGAGGPVAEGASSPGAV